MTLQAGGNIGGQTPDVGSAAEVTVDTTSLSADLPTGGVRINFVPQRRRQHVRELDVLHVHQREPAGRQLLRRAAGRRPRARRTRSSTTSTSTSRSAARSSATRCGSGSRRATTPSRTRPPIFDNTNAFNPNEWLYVPDTTSPAVNKGEQFNNSIRVTWQATPKNKIAGTYKADKWCNCPNNISATRRARGRRATAASRVCARSTREWTSPITNKLLFEAVGLHLFERWGDMHLRVNGGSLDDPAQEAILPQMISVTEQSNEPDLPRPRDHYNNTLVPNCVVPRGGVVRHRHARVQGRLQPHARVPRRVPVRAEPGAATASTTACPNQITDARAPVPRRSPNLDNDLGLFAQDRWTMDRLTLNLALRFDYVPDQLPRADARAGAADAEPQHHVPGSRQPQLEGHHLPHRLRPTTCSATARPR